MDGGAEEVIRAALIGQLAGFKIPSKIRLTTDDLLRTGTGKLLKRDLRTLYFPTEAAR
jgi:acyl-CoA synthetase (AMP-forming)/AMP-acid ligase II